MPHVINDKKYNHNLHNLPLAGHKKPDKPWYIHEQDAPIVRLEKMIYQVMCKIINKNNSINKQIAYCRFDLLAVLQPIARYLNNQLANKNIDYKQQINNQYPALCELETNHKITKPTASRIITATLNLIPKLTEPPEKLTQQFLTYINNYCDKLK